jgi:peptidoglycan-associated lipoprotein
MGPVRALIHHTKGDSMMLNFRTGLSAAVCTMALLVAGCSSTKLDEEAPVETGKPVPVDGTGAGGAGANSAGASQSGVATVDLSKSGAGSADAAAMAQRVVYFDFDSFIVKEEYRPMLEAHAKALSANRNKHMTLEGHTDELGGREYNLALGQKRAEAVLKALVLLGVQPGQLEAVSFGEERPASTGTDEASRAKNRRVEMKDN